MTASFTLIPIIELCRYCPGMVTAMGVSVGPHLGRHHGARDRAPRSGGGRSTCSRWTRSGRGPSPSRARGPTPSARCGRRPGATATSTCSTARRRSSPTVPTPTPSCSSASSTRATTPAERKVLSFVLDRGMPGLEQSKPLRKMGMHSSPTGELFLTDVRVGRDRLIGETEDVPGGRAGAKDTFSMERSGVAAMALGIIEQCLELCVAVRQEPGAVRPARSATSSSSSSSWPRWRWPA